MTTTYIDYEGTRKHRCCGRVFEAAHVCTAVSPAERQRRAAMKTTRTAGRRTAAEPPNVYYRAAREEPPLHNGCPDGYGLSAIPDYGKRQIPASSLMDQRMAPTPEARRAATPPDPYRIVRPAAVRGSEAA